MNQVPVTSAMAENKVGAFPNPEIRGSLQLSEKTTSRPRYQRLTNTLTSELPDQVNRLSFSTGEAPGQIYMANVHTNSAQSMF